MNTFAADFLRGKTAVVAGGTSGVGLAIAGALAERGARVALLGRNRDKAETAAASLRGRGLALVADVRDYAAVTAELERAASALGAFDIVVAGAAGNFIAAADTMSANAFKTVVDIDLNGTFHVFRAAFALLNTPGAALLAISAGQSTRACAGQAHAAAAKAGINMLVKNLALEWGPQGIRVNAIVPGPIAGTEGLARLSTAEQRAALAQRIPLRRLGRADEVANTALFLLSAAASYVTGAIVECDGGSQLG